MTTSNLIDFVQNFTTNKLDRHLKSDTNSKHSHFYSPDNKRSKSNYYPYIDQNIPQPKLEFVELQMISSENFIEFIWQANKVSEPVKQDIKISAIYLKTYWERTISSIDINIDFLFPFEF